MKKIILILILFIPILLNAQTYNKMKINDSLIVGDATKIYPDKVKTDTIEGYVKGVYNVGDTVEYSKGAVLLQRQFIFSDTTLTDEPKSHYSACLVTDSANISVILPPLDSMNKTNDVKTLQFLLPRAGSYTIIGHNNELINGQTSITNNVPNSAVTILPTPTQWRISQDSRGNTTGQIRFIPINEPSGISTYLKTTLIPDSVNATEQIIYNSITNGVNNPLFQFVTDTNVFEPGSVTGGNALFRLRARISSGGGDAANYFVAIYKRDALGNEVLLNDSTNRVSIPQGTSLNYVDYNTAIFDYTYETSDRFVFKVFANEVTGGPVIVVGIEGLVYTYYTRGIDPSIIRVNVGAAGVNYNSQFYMDGKLAGDQDVNHYSDSLVVDKVINANEGVKFSDGVQTSKGVDSAGVVSVVENTELKNINSDTIKNSTSLLFRVDGGVSNLKLSSRTLYFDRQNASISYGVNLTDRDNDQSLPSYGFTNDLYLGMYRRSADLLAFRAGAVTDKPLLFNGSRLYIEGGDSIPYFSEVGSGGGTTYAALKDSLQNDTLSNLQAVNIVGDTIWASVLMVEGDSDGFTYTSSDGVAFVSDTTAKVYQLQNIINTHSQIILSSGTYTIDSTLLIPSNFHFEIARGAILKLADSANCHLFHNAGLGYDGLGTGIDSNITIDGGGILEGNGSNQQRVTYVPGSMYNWELFWLGGIDGLIFRDIELRNARTFVSRFSGNPNVYPFIPLQNFVIENIKINQYNESLNNGDGIHINGPVKNGTISNIYGTSVSDDYFALIPDDSPYSTWGYVGYGTIENVIIDGVKGDGSYGMRSVLDTSDFKNVTVQNCNIKTNLRMADFDGRSYSGTGKIKDFTVQNNIFIADTSQAVFNNFDISALTDGVKMINNTYYGKNQNVFYRPGTSLLVKDEVYKDQYVSPFGGVYTLGDTADFEKVIIDNVDITYIDTTSGFSDRLGVLLNVRSNAKEVEIKNCDLSKMRYIYSSDASNDTIDKLIIDNCTHFSSRRESFLVGTSIREIIINNCRIGDLASIMSVTNFEKITITNSIIDSIGVMFNFGANYTWDSIYVTLTGNTITRIKGRPFAAYSDNATDKWIFIQSSGNKLQYDSSFENTPLFSYNTTYNHIRWSSDDFIINKTYVTNPREGDRGVFMSGSIKIPAYYSNGNWYNLITGATL